VYCPGPKSILKLVENDDNLIDLPQPLLDEKLSTLSVAQLSDLSAQTAENVTGLLAGVRDEIVESVIQRKNNCSLNFGFGILSLRANGTVEFRSSAVTQVAEGQNEDKIPNSAEFGDNVS
jgi:hypothetical protein